jgi:RimJ/RimL family protein N-acetyltransferase
MKKKMQPIVFIEGKRLYLRPVSLSDVPLITRYVNDPEVRRWLSSIHPCSEQSEEEYVKKMVMDDNPTNILFAVVLKRADKFLGMMGLHRISHVDGTASTGSMLGAKDEWNKGYGTEAKMLLLEYAFHTLNLRKIKSDAFAPNLGSINHNKKCGYQVEGVLKDDIFRNGTYHDRVMLAVFRSTWEKKFKKVPKK